MAIGVLIEALLGGPSASATTSQSITTSDNKGGVRQWIECKLKAPPQLLGKLAAKALASLPGIIGSIISWILNSKRSSSLVISKFVGTHNRRWSLDIHIFHDKDKEKVIHLNIHHTVKTDIIPNTKATFSSSQVFIFLSG